MNLHSLFGPVCGQLCLFYETFFFWQNDNDIIQLYTYVNLILTAVYWGVAWRLLDLKYTLKSWHIIKNSNKIKWKQIKRMTGVYVRFVLTSLTEHQSARSEHICQCLRKIMKVLIWIVWQCVPGRLIDNFTLLVTRLGTPLYM